MTSNAMDRVEPLVQEAIRLLESRGLFLQAGEVRERLERFESAPTAAARQRHARGIDLPPVTFGQFEARERTTRWRRTASDSGDEKRYFRLRHDLARATGRTE